MPDILIKPSGVRIAAEKGSMLLQAVTAAGITLTSHCSGLGRCGRCRIQVTKGRDAVNKPTGIEREHLTARELSRDFRLACQVKIWNDIEINVPDESIISRVRLQIEGSDTRLKPMPAVKKYYTELVKPALDNLEPDTERLLSSLPVPDFRSTYISFNILKNLPETLRKADWKVTTTLHNGKEVLDVEEAKVIDSCYGLSIDVGTTKIACNLVDLNTGVTLSTSGMINPQIIFGEDLIARISYASESENNRKELQKRVIGGINDLISECCSKQHLEPRHIYEAVIVCNTAMHHLLLGISSKYLILSPYVPAIKGSIDIKARELNFNINPEACINFLPAIAGFIGSDCVADILATGLFNRKAFSLLLDLGTNTEMVIGNRNRMISCSCASGPAFEGGHITHGMQAMSGAIDSVTIDRKTFKVHFSTIDKGKPKGICGSGIVDCIAEMLKVGVIDRKGVIKTTGLHGVRINKDGQAEFVVAANNPESFEIVLTQKDIAEFQLAKAAVYTGAVILMEEMGIKPEQLKHMYIAGAFGKHLNFSNALVLGMIPVVPPGIVTGLGNAAISGARMALVSTKARKMCHKISGNVEYLELSVHPGFQSIFMESLQFKQI